MKTKIGSLVLLLRGTIPSESPRYSRDQGEDLAWGICSYIVDPSVFIFWRQLQYPAVLLLLIMLCVVRLFWLVVPCWGRYGSRMSQHVKLLISCPLEVSFPELFILCFWNIFINNT